MDDTRYSAQFYCFDLNKVLPSNFLWNALTGEKLFDTDALAMSIRQLVSRDPPPPSEVEWSETAPPPVRAADIERFLLRQFPREEPARLAHLASALERSSQGAAARIDETPVEIVPRFGINAEGVTVTDQRYPRAGTPNDARVTSPAWMASSTSDTTMGSKNRPRTLGTCK